MIAWLGFRFEVTHGLCGLENCSPLVYNQSMAAYDDYILKRLDILRAELEKYFIDTAGPCPYGLQQTAIYHQAMFANIPSTILEVFFAEGYRRNGNCLYTMACKNCQACVPLRLDPTLFIPNRNQRRIARKNKDITATTGPMRISAEKLALCNRFLQTRYPGRHNSAEEYYAGFFINTGSDTYEIVYRLGEQLVGVAIVDCGEHFVNAVYFYFDPTEKNRSLGTYNILHLMEFCQEKKITWLYLGYWIKEVQAMSYKANFKPHYLLKENTWNIVEYNVPAS